VSKPKFAIFSRLYRRQRQSPAKTPALTPAFLQLLAMLQHPICHSDFVLVLKDLAAAPALRSDMPDEVPWRHFVVHFLNAPVRSNCMGRWPKASRAFKHEHRFR